MVYETSQDGRDFSDNALGAGGAYGVTEGFGSGLNPLILIETVRFLSQYIGRFDNATASLVSTSVTEMHITNNLPVFGTDGLHGQSRIIHQHHRCQTWVFFDHRQRDWRVDRRQAFNIHTLPT